MKKTTLNIAAVMLFPVMLFAQTPKQVAKMQESLNREYHSKVTEYLQRLHLEKEERVQNYITKTGEERIQILEDGTSMYMIDVSSKGKPVYYTVDNAAAAAGTLTTTMHGFTGLDTEGSGMTIGVWDENRALGTHQEFTVSSTNSTSRMSYGDNAITGTSTNHATHVAGTMVARGAQPNARGMAFRANIVSYNWADDRSEVQTASNNGMLVTNHSYGVPLYNNGVFNVDDWVPGNYSSEAVAWDDIAYSNPYTLSVVSAGNDGTNSNPYALENGWDKLIGNKVSKNNLVVANASNPIRNSNGELVSVAINSGSSQGPSDDLRIKPDISGVGTNLYSPIGTSNTSYATLSGTSMAAPNVSGSILLLQQYHDKLYDSFMRAATLKGIVCLTADDAGTEGPDPRFGWGLLNMKTASDLIRLKGENKAVIEENILTTGQTYTETVTLTESGTLLAGISWTDYPGTAKNGVLNSASSKALVNDLDIRVTKDGETYLPWTLNIFNKTVAVKGDNISDNIEVVRINNAEAGVYTITVTGKGSMYSPPGQPAGQAYSLIVYAKDLVTTASRDNLDLLSEIKIYPNPVAHTLFVESLLNNPINKVEIYDAIGKKILTSELNNNAVNISHLTSGVYFVKVYSGESQITRKIIKK